MKKKMRKRAMAAVLCVMMMGVGLAGCGDSSDTQGGGDSQGASSGENQNDAQDNSQGDGLIIKFIAMYSASVFWTSLHTGA